MKCEAIRDNLVLASYGELPDEQAEPLERHLAECEECQRELQALRAMDELLALLPVVEPSPNLVAQSRMRLDELLDTIPPHGFISRLRTNFFIWMGHMQSAPALATLLVGVGFLGGNFTYRYQVSHSARQLTPASVSSTAPSLVANVTSVSQTPGSELVQVSYNRLVPEKVTGSLDTPEIRQLLLQGLRAGANDGVRGDSVALLANECRIGHECLAGEPGKGGIRSALMVSLRYDKDAGVRLKALEGLQRYIGQDQRVRDAVLESVLRDESPNVRRQAISMLAPVQSDSSVRQVLRTVSTQDANPYIRSASFEALQGAGDIQ